MQVCTTHTKNTGTTKELLAIDLADPGEGWRLEILWCGASQSQAHYKIIITCVAHVVNTAHQAVWARIGLSAFNAFL